MKGCWDACGSKIDRKRSRWWRSQAQQGYSGHGPHIRRQGAIIFHEHTVSGSDQFFQFTPCRQFRICRERGIEHGLDGPPIIEQNTILNPRVFQAPQVDHPLRVAFSHRERLHPLDHVSGRQGDQEQHASEVWPLGQALLHAVLQQAEEVRRHHEQRRACEQDVALHLRLREGEKHERDPEPKKDRPMGIVPALERAPREPSQGQVHQFAVVDADLLQKVKHTAALPVQYLRIVLHVEAGLPGCFSGECAVDVQLPWQEDADASGGEQQEMGENLPFGELACFQYGQQPKGQHDQGRQPLR